MDLLSQLKDIHYPKAISFWPLATGWYLVIAVFFACLLIGLFIYLRHLKKTAMRRKILRKISDMRQQLSDHDKNFFEELSILLKRAALYAFPREEVASLYGESWLKFLDRTFNNTQAFTQGVGKILGTAPYQNHYDFQREEFFSLIEAWVKKNL